MRRKTTTKDDPSSLHERNQTNNNNNDSNDLYRKRLRSWKQTSTPLNLNHTTNAEITPSHRSTIYTYPIHLNHDGQSTPSSAMLSESCAMESAFYCPSISTTSIQTTDDVNNNHVTTLNVDNRKRKSDSSSCESLSSQVSPIKTLEILTNMNDGKNMNTKRSSSNNLHLTYHQNSTKRSRFSTDASVITDHRSWSSPVFVDGDTIDINQLDQQEPLLSSMNNESLINNSTSMEAAVKMVQPIVDIIFNAFEDQLKHVQTRSIPSSSLSNTPHFSSPVITPYSPLSSPARPIVLHAVNFNIQLTAKQSNNNAQHSTNVRLSENDHLQLISLTDLKERAISYILSNSLISTHPTSDDHYERRRRRNLKRIVQLAVVGVSILCGYWFL